ncbi:MAG: triose-phosphate isomerase [Bdellovibrionales bacterium]|nr:triose-phosphate isomerase [Bdellovibrionales bacterium]
MGFICAGNWKLNKGPKEANEFFEDFQAKAQGLLLSDFAIYPSAFSLYTVSQELREKGFNWGAQNIYWESSGAFTGENSVEILKEMGATQCLVGHSERRALFGETNEQTAQKMLALANQGITPVLCVGETLQERKSGQTNAVITSQLREALKGWNANNSFWLAYEPVWAIGTGEVATPQQAEEAHQVLRAELEKLLAEKSKKTPILYGGSVKPENAFELAKMPNVDGFLIGGASLKVDFFRQIYQQGTKAKQSS